MPWPLRHRRAAPARRALAAA
ncbi:MAG: hypothetical protein K0R11_994, partial [Acidimicrobiales bacterium]|nr:hypothetical protein [Acidimicrobiales bacterium]